MGIVYVKEKWSLDKLYLQYPISSLYCIYNEDNLGNIVRIRKYPFNTASVV